MRRPAVLLVAAGLTALLLPTAVAGADTAGTGRLLVTLRAPHGATTAVAARAHARTALTIPQLRAAAVSPRGTQSLGALARRLRADPTVASVRPERRYTLRYVPDDPAFTELGRGDVVEWWALRENFPAAWDLARDGGARVAIIDTGADASHPELAGRIVDRADFDDIPSHAGADFDEVGHGTHVASLACGAADNGLGIAGAGLNCDLLIAKSDLTEGSVAQALVWAADRGAEAINMSFGTDGSTPASSVIVDALHYAARHGAVLVAAAADEPTDEQGDPANVLQPTGSGRDIDRGLGLTVTAADANDRRASFAGRGSQISIAAYGTYGSGANGILGAFPQNPTELEAGSLVPPAPPCGCRTVFTGDARYAYLQGTSMAAPMVAATAAVLRHVNPDLGPAEVVRLLKDTARGNGWTPDLGWGILDAGTAVGAARDKDRRAPTSKMRPPKVRGHTILLGWTGRDPALPFVPASGIARYEVWRAVAGHTLRRIATTKRTSMRVRGRRRTRYIFFTIAIDRAGNREAPPLRPDARVRVR